MKIEANEWYQNSKKIEKFRLILLNFSKKLNGLDEMMI